MPRLSKIDPATDTGPGAELLNGPLKSMQINIFKGMAVNRPALEAYLGFSKGIKNVLSPREHEVVALTVAQKRNCEYCVAAHVQIAKGQGISEDESLKIRQYQAGDGKEQALIDFTLAVIETDGFVTDDQLNNFRNAGFDDAAVIEVLAQITSMTFTNFFNHVNETEIDFPVPATV